jgi:hypothetical protein
LGTDARGKDALRTQIRLSCAAEARHPAKAGLFTLNLAIFDFTLSHAEMTEIARPKPTGLRVVDLPHAPRWDD